MIIIIFDSNIIYSLLFKVIKSFKHIYIYKLKILQSLIYKNCFKKQQHFNINLNYILNLFSLIF